MPTISPIYMRMKQSVTWMKHNKKMLQKDIAEEMGMTDVSFSRGMERIKHKLDEDFIVSFHQATDGVFSLDWLMEGTGDMFAKQKATSPSTDEPTANIIDLCASLIKEVEQIRQQLKQELVEVQAMKQEYLAARDDFRTAIAALHPSIRYANPSDQPRMAAENTPEK